MRGKIKIGLTVVLGLAIVVGGISCLPHPIGDSEQAKFDKRLVGYWMTELDDDGRGWFAAVFQFDKRAYFVIWVSVERDKRGIYGKQALYFKGWLSKLKDQTYFTLEPISDPANDPGKFYIVHRMDKIGEDKLKTQLLDGDFEPFKNAKSRKELEAAVIANAKNEEALQDLEYQRLDPKLDANIIKRLMPKPLGDWREWAKQQDPDAPLIEPDLEPAPK